MYRMVGTQAGTHQHGTKERVGFHSLFGHARRLTLAALEDGAVSLKGAHGAAGVGDALTLTAIAANGNECKATKDDGNYEKLEA